MAVRAFLMIFSLVGFPLILSSCWSSSDSEEESVEPSSDGDEAAQVEESQDTAAPEAAPTDPAAAPQAESQPPVNAAPPADAAAPSAPAGPPAGQSPVSAPMTPDMSGGTVQYVSAKVAAVYEKPDRGSLKVATLTRGDHVLVTVEGEWAKTSEGRYIESKHLSKKAIGKKKQPARWK